MPSHIPSSPSAVRLTLVLILLAALPALANPALRLVVSTQTAASATVELRMTDIPCCQAGYQAFVRLSPELRLVAVEYNESPFWVHLYDPPIVDGNDISFAAGIDFFAGEPGEQGSAILARIYCERLQPCGGASFLAHAPPTEFVTLDGEPYRPALIPLSFGACATQPTAEAD